MTRRHFLALLLLCLVSPRTFASNPQPPQWIVVTAPAFRAALEPLCDHRRAEGMKVVLIETTKVLAPPDILGLDSKRLAERVQRLARMHDGKTYVLLVGAVEAGNLEEPARKMLPCLAGTAGRMTDQPTDNGFGCLDDSLLPTVAVGRFPARTVEEAERMVWKTLAYECNTEPGDWRQRITVLAGVPAFTPLVDRLIETMAMSRFGKLDPRWTVRALYHNESSRFCVPDSLLHARSLQYVREGQALTLYLGHSWAKGLYAPKARFLDREDWAALRIERGPGIFATFGCNGCQLWGPEGEGYGVSAMRNPFGPVAVIGSHGICFAAMCQLGADGMLETVGAGRFPERVAEVYLKVKQGIAHGKMDALSYRLLDAADGDSKIPQDEQRQEHLEMFLLLGDPALRLPRVAHEIKLSTAATLTPGSPIVVQGELPAALTECRIKLTLERPLTSVPAGLQPLPANSAPERQQVMLANHERANQFVLQSQEFTVIDRRFQVQLWLPDGAPQYPRLLVRAYGVSGNQEAQGVAILEAPAASPAK